MNLLESQGWPRLQGSEAISITDNDEQQMHDTCVLRSSYEYMNVGGCSSKEVGRYTKQEEMYADELTYQCIDVKHRI